MQANERTYTNPIFSEGQDPKVAFKDGYFYYVKWSHSGNLNHIYKTRSLDEPGDPKVLPAGVPLNIPIFIDTLNGHTINKWYIFGHGVWECNGNDPYTENWTLKQGDLYQRAQYRLDYYTFFYKGELFIAWAGNERQNNTGWWFESVFISRVTYDGSNFSLVTPDASVDNMVATYSFGPGYGPRFNSSDVVVEAPAVYTPSQFGFSGRDDELFMLLSIDGAHTNWYAIGMIVFTGSTPAQVTSPNHWQKVNDGGSERLFASHNPNQSPTPLAAKGLKGPGVPALVPFPDNSKLWMYYHSKHNDNFNRQATTEYEWIRRVMLQEIGWKTHNGRLIPDFFAKPIIGVGETGTIPTANQAIILSAIPDQTIPVNTETGTLPFTVGQEGGSAGSLVPAGSSSNTDLVPDNNIVFGGSGENRTVTVTPTAGQMGSAMITVTMSDGALAGSTSFAVTVISDALPMVFDFDDGTMDHWTLTSTDGQNRQLFAVVPPILNSPNGTPHSGSHFIGLHIPAFDLGGGYTQDSEHGTLVIRSPEFTLNGSGNLTAWLSGGGSGSVSLAGTSVASLPTTSSTNGFLGVALRNVTTGTYVLSTSKSSGGGEWEQVSFTAAQLAGLPQGDVYTLDLIDARDGGWGWVNMDSVTIPGGTSGEEPPPNPTLTRYIQINGGEWLQQGSATLCAGGTVSFSPHPIEENWQWSGPNGFSSNTREVTLSNITTAQAGNYVATYTANGGSASVTYTVNVHALPEATVSVAHETCAGGNGSITLTFPDTLERSNISFSIDGGQTYPAIVSDNTGSYEFTGLAPGIYDVWARWGNQDCPIDLGLHTIHADPLPRADVAITNPSEDQNNGTITLTFPDTEQRANISFSINGGVSYTSVPDNSGSYTFSNLEPGDYEVWSRWGNQQCPIQLGDYSLIRDASDFEGDPTYDFDDGTFQSWTDLTPANSNSGPRNWAPSPPAFPGVTHSGAGAIGQHVEGGGIQDSSHPTLWLRSPEFVLDGSGALRVWLFGGAGSGSLTGVPVGSVPAQSSEPGFQGVALRNANTETFVLSGSKNSSGDDWEQIVFTASELAALDQNAVYTLDLIDAGHGGWGWVAMDSVTIPGEISGEEPPPPPPSPPTISSISGQTIFVNTSTGTLSFTVGSEEVAPGTLTLTGSSSNTTLAPNGNIVFGGSGAERTVAVTPSADQTGSSTITVTVSDGVRTASTTFVVTVVSEALPVDFDFAAGTLSGWTEAGTDGQERQFFAVVPPSVSSPNITPHSGDYFIGLHIPAFDLDAGYTQDSEHDTLILSSPEFMLNGSGNLTVWLAGGGSAGVSLAGTNVASLPTASSTGGFLGVALRSVTTGTFVLSASKSIGGNEWEQVSFTSGQLAALPPGDIYTLDLIDARHGGWGWVNMDTVTIPGEASAVEPPPPSPLPPTISAISDQTIPVNTSTGALSFTVGSEEVNAGTLTLSGSSSNTTLVPQANIVFGGSGEERTVTVTPTADQTGSATISIAVDDGFQSSSVSFTLGVLSGEEPPVDVVVNPGGAPPVHFFLARAWHWDTDGDTEGWVTGGNSHLALDPGAPLGGLLSGTSTDVDPQWFSPSNLGIPATEDMILEFRIRKQSADGTRMDLFWQDSTGNFGGDRLQSIPANALPRDGEFHVVRMHFSDAIQGILSRLRFDPISGSPGIGMSFDLDYLRIYTTALPESSVPPTLAIERWGENQVRLSWPSVAVGWTLQSSGDHDGVYSNAGLEVTVEGDENAVYDGINEASARFYRLRQIP